MAVRERDELWERAMRQLAYRERELAELSEDYLALERRNQALMGVIRRQAARDRAERDERRRTDAANEAASG